MKEIERAEQSINWFQNVINKQGRLLDFETMKSSYYSLFKNNPNKLNEHGFKTVFDSFKEALEEANA